MTRRDEASPNQRGAPFVAIPSLEHGDVLPIHRRIDENGPQERPLRFPRGDGGRDIPCCYVVGLRSAEGAFSTSDECHQFYERGFMLLRLMLLRLMLLRLMLRFVLRVMLLRLMLGRVRLRVSEITRLRLC